MLQRFLSSQRILIINTKILNFCINILIFNMGNAILKKRKAPTPKWMLPRRLNYLSARGAFPVCRQGRHYFFFFPDLLSRKVRNATIKLPRDISKANIPMKIEMISYAVISRTSLPMYSGQAGHIGSGGYHPVMGTFLHGITMHK